jgi:hypothetical protein
VKNKLKKIEAAAYNGARTVHIDCSEMKDSL